MQIAIQEYIWFTSIYLGGDTEKRSVYRIEIGGNSNSQKQQATNFKISDVSFIAVVNPGGHSTNPAIVFRIFWRGNSISINGIMGISAAAAMTTIALMSKGKNFNLLTVS